MTDNLFTVFPILLLSEIFANSWDIRRSLRSRIGLGGKFSRVPAQALAQGRPPLPGEANREAYLALFTGGLNDLLLVGAIIALAGGVLSFALIRGQDFLASQPAGAQPQAPVDAAAA